MFPVPVCGPSILTPALFTASDDFPAGSRSGEWAVDDARINRTYQNRIKVDVSTPYVGPLQVLSSLGVTIGQTYRFPLIAAPATETDTGSFVQRIRAEQTAENNLQWVVTIDYAPFDVIHQLGSSDLSYGIICPTDRAYEVWWESAKYERYKTEDESQPTPLPYQNTVGDPLLDPPATEETRPVLNIARNESTYNDAYASQFKDTVNSGEFLGYPPNCVKCKDIKGERHYDSDWGYYHRVTYQFEFRDDDDGNGYTKLILNAGYRQKINGSGDPVNVVDAAGNQVTDAVPLQKNGSYQPEAEPYFLEFQQFPSMDFGQLNIPDDILLQDS